MRNKRTPIQVVRDMATKISPERVHQETRPKHAGVHQDQNKRHHSKHARREARRALKRGGGDGWE